MNGGHTCDLLPSSLEYQYEVVIGLKSELHEIIFISIPPGSRCVPDPGRLHVVSVNHCRDGGGTLVL